MLRKISYAFSKFDYSVRENIYLLPSDMNLKIRSGTVEYNNEILVSDGKFSLGKNVEVNTPEMKSTQIAATHRDSHHVLAHAPAMSHKKQEPQIIIPIDHNDEKIALVLALASGFAIWNMFR